MAKQLRIYTMKEECLDRWVSLWTEKLAPLRRRSGFTVAGYAVPDKGQFVWVLDRPGTREEFLAADTAYYQLPEHPPLHEEGKRYLASAESWFLEPVETEPGDEPTTGA